LKAYSIKYIIILIVLFKSGELFGQHELIIEINSLRNSKGQILVDLRDDKNKKIDGFIRKITEKKCIIIIKNLKPGNYAFKYFHDENNNKELETNWIGIPVEGYGYSNNAEGTFGPPKFEDTIFEVKSDVIQRCKPTYF